MNTVDLIPLLPLILVSVTAVAVLIEIAIRRNYQIVYLTSLAGLVLSGLSLFLASQNLPVHVTPLLVVDSYGLYFVAIILVAAFAVTAIAYPYFRSYPDQPEEFFALLLTATLGAMVLALSNHFVSFFLGLELLSISLYGMIAYPSLYRDRIEASIKYLVLAGITSSFLLFGMALIYISMGTMDFSQMSLSKPILPGFQLVLTAGWGLLLAGFGFKLALVPFQFWTPDVYQGAPAPVTAFIATVSKGGTFALMLRYFSLLPIVQIPTLWDIFAVIAIASMLFGNIVALVQNDVKRILAYSSIAHLGYVDYGILNSLQVDRYGNINSSVIGRYQDGEGRRFGGPGGADTIAATSWRTIVVTDQQKRKFVERVDFISSPGYLDGPGARERHGLPPDTGPWRVYTPWAMFGYGKDCQLTLQGASARSLKLRPWFSSLSPSGINSPATSTTYSCSSVAPSSPSLRATRPS